MKKLISVFVCAVIIASMLCIGVSAREYSREYPADASYNSGGPVWIHCNLQRMGEVLIILDPDTNLQSFGFDSPNGYNLINNTSSTIKGRAYPVGGNTSYPAQFPSFYMLQLQTGVGAAGNKFYEDYLVTDILGTTLDLIDYTGDRDSDFYDYFLSVSEGFIFVSVALLIIIVLMVVRMFFKSRVLRL